MAKEVNKAIIAAMQANNQFRTQGYNLHKNFAGEYTITDVKEYKTRNAEDDDPNAFRVHCKSPSGNHAINGFIFMNAYIVPKDSKIEAADTVKEGVKHIHFYDGDKVQEALRDAKYVNTLYKDENFKLPEKFEILGALVSKDARGDHPYIPLRRYPMYSVILRHHQKSDPEAYYVDRDTIDMYIDTKAITSLGKDFKFKLPDHDKKVWDMSLWNPTLIIRDWEDA